MLITDKNKGWVLNYALNNNRKELSIIEVTAKPIGHLKNLKNLNLTTWSCTFYCLFCFDFFFFFDFCFWFSSFYFCTQIIQMSKFQIVWKKLVNNRMLWLYIFKYIFISDCYPANNNLFKVSNRSTMKESEICSKISKNFKKTIKNNNKDIRTPLMTVSSIFKHISHLFLVIFVLA